MEEAEEIGFASRRVNTAACELGSSGHGGGNKENRHARIKQKNEKLRDERFRRLQKQRDEKHAQEDGEKEETQEADIHPSRLNRVKN